MKRLLILLILLFALPAYAQQCTEETPCPELARLMVVGGSTPAVAPPAYTEEFYWTGEHASGHLYAEITNRTATLNSASGDLTSTVQAHSATHSLLIDGDDEYIQYTITAGNIFNRQKGFIELWVYVDTAPSATGRVGVWETASGAGVNPMNISITNTRTVVFFSVLNGEVATTETVDLDAWSKIEVRWDYTLGASDTMQVRVKEGTWVSITGTYDEGSATAPSLRIGHYDMDFGARSSVIYIDDVSIWGTYDKS